MVLFRRARGRFHRRHFTNGLGSTCGEGAPFGILQTSSPSDPVVERSLQAFMNGLRKGGWEEGRNVVIETRFAGGDAARFADLAGELVGLNVDAIIAANTPAILAARSKSATIPIIMAGIADPVGSGWVASLARPGGNITGMVNQIETVSAMNLEVLKESKPGIKRVGIIFSPNNSPSVRTVKAMQEDVASRLGLIVLPIGVTKPEDFAEAFAIIIREQAEALHVLPTAVVVAHRAKIADFAVQQRLPTTGPVDFLARDGLLMSYGYDPRVTWSRAASYVDRIFKGANPAEIPVEQVDRFQFIINLKTARAISLDLTSLLSRADEVIE